jgi:hypothetical protein
MQWYVVCSQWTLKLILTGKKPCKGTKIEKGTLRLGVWVEIQGHGSFKWKHWGCELFQVSCGADANIKV